MADGASEAWATTAALRSNPTQFETIGNDYSEKHRQGTEAIKRLDQVVDDYAVHKGPHADLIRKTASSITGGLTSTIASYPNVSAGFLAAHTSLAALETRSDQLTTDVGAMDFSTPATGSTSTSPPGEDPAHAAAAKEFAAIRAEESKILRELKAIVEEQPTTTDVEVNHAAVAELLGLVLGDMPSGPVAENAQIAMAILDDHSDGEIDADFTERPFDGGAEQSPLRVAERNIAVIEATEAEAALREAEAMNGSLTGPQSNDPRVQLRKDAERAWAKVDRLYGGEFESYSTGQLEAEFERFDPVYRPLIQYHAGLGSAPTKLDDQRLETNLAAEALITAEEDTLDEARERLALSALAETRLTGQSEPWRGDSDVYANAEASIQYRLTSIGLDTPTATDVAQFANEQAMLAIPENRNEAANQTKAATWTAIEAENELIAFDHQTPAYFDGTEQEYFAHYAVLEQQSQAAWNETALRISMEKRIIIDSLPPHLQQTALSDFDATLDERGYPPEYIHKVNYVAADTAPISDNYFLSPEDVAAEYSERIETAYEEDGAFGFIEERYKVAEELAANPYIAGDDTFSVDPTLSAMRGDEIVAMINENVEDELALTVEEFPDQVIALSETRAETGVYEDELDLEIATRIEQASLVFPQNLVGQMVVDTKPAWDTAIEAASAPGGTFDSVFSGEDSTVVETYTIYADVADNLSFAPNGDLGVDAIVDVMNQEVDRVVESREDSVFEYRPYEIVIEEAARNGEGGTLAIELLNSLDDLPPNDGSGSNILYAFFRGSDSYLREVEERTDEYFENRLELDQLITRMASVNSDRPPIGFREPGLLGTADQDLADAIDGYLADFPDVAENDERLLDQLTDDGLNVFFLDIARQGLSDEARDRHGPEVADNIDGSFDEFFANPNAEFLVNNPLVRAQTQSLIETLIEENNIDPSMIDPDYPFSWLEGGDGSPIRALDEARLGRGATRFLKGLSKIRGFTAPDRAGISAKTLGWALPPVEFVYGLLQFYEGATSSDESARSRLYRGVFGTARVTSLADMRALVKNQAVSGQRITSLPKWLDKKVPQVGIKLSRDSITGVESWVSSADDWGTKKKILPVWKNKKLALKFVPTLGVIMLVDEVWNGYDAIQNSDEMIALAYVSLASGSLVSLAGTAGLFGAAGPPGWLTGGLYLTAAILLFQGSRINASNRYETKQARKFFSHIGSRDPETGELRPIQETSNYADHNPKINQHEAGDEIADGDIIYRGLSANAVDELMNNSDSPENPISASHVIQALAERNNVSPQEITMGWFDQQLSPHGQKEFPPLTFSVDLSQDVDQDKIVNTSFLTRPVSAGYRYILPEGSTTSSEELWEYVESELVRPKPNSRDYEIQPGKQDLLHAILTGDPVPGVELPSPEIVETLQLVYGQYGQATTLTELEAILKHRGYPAFPQPAAGANSPLPTAPEPNIDDVSFEQPYVVQEGDSLWDIAAALGEPRGLQADDVMQLIGYHNSNVQSPHLQFDPDRADSDFRSQAEWYDGRRDPDLIHPGDRITVSELARIVQHQQDLSD